MSRDRGLRLRAFRRQALLFLDVEELFDRCRPTHGETVFLVGGG